MSSGRTIFERSFDIELLVFDRPESADIESSSSTEGSIDDF